MHCTLVRELLQKLGALPGEDEVLAQHVRVLRDEDAAAVLSGDEKRTTAHLAPDLEQTFESALRMRLVAVPVEGARDISRACGERRRLAVCPVDRNSETSEAARDAKDPVLDQASQRLEHDDRK